MNLHPNLPQDAAIGKNLVDRLGFWSRNRSDEIAFYFLDEQEELAQLTYAQLDLKARAIAARLTMMGLKGERALLFFHPGLDFISAFFGCLYAGTIAVPAFPPRRNRNMARVDAISVDAQASVVLTEQDVIDRSVSLLDKDSAHLKDIPWIATADLELEPAQSWSAPELANDELAVLQYTSGSTGQPKGVMLSHANLMHNCSLITYGFNANQTSIGLFWLPTYHDMGLVGGILNPLFIGRPSVFMSPMSFLQKPIRWLRNISKFGVTISGGPNFAYALCNEKITESECEGLDLSSWSLAFNGAEPVRSDTLARFARKFKPFGFQAESLYPCYGMAESTLIVSGADRESPPLVRTFDSSSLESNIVLPCQASNSARELVSSGQVLPDQQVLIVDPETCQQSPPDKVGEIWVQSESVAQGYWNNQADTEQAFHGRLTNGNAPDDSFLRTGDLGFFHHGQLFVTGRSKDLIIVNGRNLYPHDIESIVEHAHEAIRIGGGAAFSVESDDSEQLVITTELVRSYRKYDTQEILSSIRKSVFQQLDVAPHSIVLLRVGKLPKTSSGKVQRRACRDMFLANRLDVLDQWPPVPEPTVDDKSNKPAKTSSLGHRSFEAIQSWMTNRIAKQLNLRSSDVDVDETFAFFGLDSVTLIGISGELENWLGRQISPKLLFSYPTIKELSEYLAAPIQTDSTSTSLKSDSDSEAQPGPAPGQNETAQSRLRKPASEILAELDDLSAAETAAMLRELLEEEARRETTSHQLSHGQRALWFIHQLNPLSPAYNLMYATHVRENFDRAAFCRAAQSIVIRHETLRTTYTTVEGVPKRVVRGFQKFEMDVVDARAWNQEKLSSEIQSRSDAPFDLENGPVLRVQLLERDEARHIMLFVAHHIALDFWAFELLLDELKLLYREKAGGSKSNLPAPRATYNDFVDWQEQELDCPSGERSWDYWKSQLDGELPPLDLPLDHPRPAVQTYQGKSVPFQVPDNLSQTLTELSKSEGVTLFATFLAAFQVLLHRYTGQREILVGCPTAGRSKSEFENVLGYFANPIALRARLKPKQTFTSFLNQVRDLLVGGITNQDFPFPLLVQRLLTTRDTSRSPIFQVAISWDTLRQLELEHVTDVNTINPADDAGTLGLVPFEFGQQGSAFDLTLMLVNNEGSVSGTFQYNQDLFDEPTIAGMVDHFLTLLEGISVQPESLLKDLPLLTVSEQQTLVHQGNETSMDSSGCDRIHELFESQVKQVPDNVAVEFDGNRLTYRELNEQANRVAHRLAKLGVESDTLVGVYLHRSIEMLVGLLGVLKSGAAFVPLSPETPSERLSGILDQCESPLVLTSDSLLKKLPSFGGQSVSLDPELLFGGESTDDPSRRVAPSDLAYVIFTSGSTGQPKGVQIEHRSVVNFLASMKLRPGIQSDDILLAVTTFTFDISVLELFLPLTVGGKVLIVDERTSSDGVQLSELIQRTSPTIMQATPSTWRLLVEAGWSGDPRLKLLCGGEALPPDLAESLIPRCGSLWNMYGPTETTIWSAVDDVKVSCNPMPIGRPIANTQLYILDDDLRPVPRGVKGSLFIGGNGLARGYLGKPELTSKHFVDDPFDPQKKGRLYRTGDLARHRTDGKIEFLGREDFQVKVRGFRIELNEIETQLIAHAEILQAIVLASNFSSRIDDKQLVAYFTFDKSAPNTSELRDYLRQKLPDYMVPSVFIPLDSFPLNSAGKINRLQLPRPGTIRPNLQSQFVAPRNATEKQMAAVWAKVLGLDSVGINDNFFDLGGASLQSLEIASLAGDSGIEMLPASLFQYPTIADLVAFGLGRPVEETSDDADLQLDLMTSPKVPTSVQPEVNDDEFGKRQVQKSNIVIESIGVYLPPKTLATRDVVAGCKKKVRFPLEDMTGIQSRHVSAENEFTSDIACAAVKECLNHSRFQPEQIDLVICCHIGRDEKENSAALEPGTAMYLKQKFDFPNAVAFDINNACAGMFTGIDIAESYIQSGAAHRVLVVSAEHISPVMTTAQQEVAGFIDPRIACLTLGDAGAAIILESSPADDVGFQELELYSLSKYSSMCIGKPTDQKHGGPILVVPNPIKHTSIAIKNSIAHSKLVMDRNSWDPDAIQWVIMHQTSERSLLDGARAINKSFKRNICTPENTINNLSQRGNTASTSHFVALWDNIRNGKIKSRDKIVFGITGSGQTIGTGLYTLDDLPDRIRNPKLTVKPTEKLERTTNASQLKSQRANQRVRISSVGVRSPDSDGALETLPMVREAVQACLKEANCDIREIDLVLFAGVYRTGFVSEPALATMIAGDLKINHAIQPGDARCTFAFDVVNGSLGFLTACDIATQSIRSGKIQKALVVASEVENNRAKFPNHLIGLKETASAVILESCPLGINGFGEFVVKYMPEKLEARTVTGNYTPSGPLVQLEQDSEIEDLFLSMIPDAVSELLARERISMKDIKLVMPPQFSRSFIDRLGVALDLPRAAMVDIAEKQDWYTSALPGTFREIESNQLSKPGDIGIVINVGAGLQVGCATYHF